MYYLFFLISILCVNNSGAMANLFKAKSSKSLKSDLNDAEKTHAEIVGHVREKLNKHCIRSKTVCTDLTPLAQLFFLDDNAFQNCREQRQTESINIGIAFINQMMKEQLLSLEHVYQLVHQHVKSGRDKAKYDWQYPLFNDAMNKIEELAEKNILDKENIIVKQAEGGKKEVILDQLGNLICSIHRTDSNTISRAVPIFLCSDSARYVDLFVAQQKKKGWSVDAIKSLDEYLSNQVKTIDDENFREIFFIRYAYFRNQLPQEILKTLPNLADSISEYELIGIDQATGARPQQDRYDCFSDPKTNFYGLLFLMAMADMR